MPPLLPYEKGWSYRDTGSGSGRRAAYLYRQCDQDCSLSHRYKKVYVGTVALGSATETEDATGNVVEEKEVTHMPGKKDIEAALEKFRGTITQIPPMYSAVKVNGKKLYEYARANEEVERPIREVFIHDIQLGSIDEEKALLTST